MGVMAQAVSKLQMSPDSIGRRSMQLASHMSADMPAAAQLRSAAATAAAVTSTCARSSAEHLHLPGQHAGQKAGAGEKFQPAQGKQEAAGGWALMWADRPKDLARPRPRARWQGPCWRMLEAIRWTCGSGAWPPSWLGWPGSAHTVAHITCAQAFWLAIHPGGKCSFSSQARAQSS